MKAIQAPYTTAEEGAGANLRVTTIKENTRNEETAQVGNREREREQLWQQNNNKTMQLEASEREIEIEKKRETA